MADRPYVVLSCSMSVDGYIDDASAERLLLSNDEDFDRVDHERAMSDAVLVGAGTVRVDDPRLLVRAEARRADRVARGLSANPIKVTLTRSGNIDPAARFFTLGDSQKLVYCPTDLVDRLQLQLGERATVVDAGQPADLRAVLGDLKNRGVQRLMVEGGSTIHTQFLAADLADELQLVVAPFFVGDPAAPRFVSPARFPHDSGAPMKLVESRPVGDVVLLRYQLQGENPSANRRQATTRPSDADRQWMKLAIELTHRCPPSSEAYSVGAVIVDEHGQEISRGYSRETDGHVHAEESALAKLAGDDPRLRAATLYSTLEPCSQRKSRPRSCTQLILDAGIPRVVLAWREPSLFVDCHGYELLTNTGVTVVELPELAEDARAANTHLRLSP